MGARRARQRQPPPPMTPVRVTRLVRAIAAPLGFALASLVAGSPASAFETDDGRFQLHGYYQMQLRGISANWSDQFDLTQWYNILNLEFELDLAPDGFEPIFDAASAYVRAEVRFDCIYYDGCGMISSVNTYGNDSRNLPERLSGGRQLLSAGSLAASQSQRDVFTAPADQPSGGLTESQVEITLSGSTVYPSNDPGNLIQGGPFKSFADGSGYDRYNGAGPTLPEFNSPSNPTLGEDILRLDDPFLHIFDNDLISIHGTAINGLGGGGFGLPVTNLLPWRPRDWSNANALLADKVNPYNDTQTTPQTQAAYYNVEMYEQITLAFQDAGEFPAGPLPLPDFSWGPGQMTVGEESTYFNAKLRQALESYDTSDPFATPPTFAEQAQRLADWKASAEIASTTGTPGIGALPLRPMPCKNAVGNCVPDPVSATGAGAAQGLYLPSKALRSALDSGRVEERDFREVFKHNQISRAFNHGWSQSRTYELKEAYLDLETFDSRLWLRLGKQNIVWGKTELFRTTDQFNPQDLSLASLPSLEESRIPLLAFRGVYSLYNIGPLEDVRFEVAINFDEFQGLDFGTCGEPYAPSIVCSVGTGALAHGTTGIGVVGVELPPAPWEDIKGLQGGARLEFRHDRFSFALSDYYGYSALPHINTLTEYDRNVDPAMGRMRTVGSLGPCINGNEQACLQAGPTHFNDASYNPRPGLFPDMVQDYLNGNNVDRLTDEPRNALEAHPVNQQVYAFACSVTIGTIRVGTGGTCATSLFNDPQTVSGFPVGQLTASALAGTFGAGAGIAVAGCSGNLADLESCLAKGDIATEEYVPPFQLVPLVELNRDGFCPDTDPLCALGNPTRRPYIGDLENASFGAPTTKNPQANCYVPRPVPRPGLSELDFLATCGGEGFGWMPRVTGGNALSEYLTPHQEALLGCGPFFGIHCDLQGVDLMNTDASVLLQSWIGFDGTTCTPGDAFCWRTGAAEWDPVAGEIVAVPLDNPAYRRPQPGTRNFLTGEEGIQAGPNQILGGPVGTRYDRLTGRASVLPGAARSVIPNGSEPFVTLNPNWNPRIDGCSLLWSEIPSGEGNIEGLSYRQYCERSTTFAPGDASRTPIEGSQDLLHPFALDESGNPQKFASELAALSWNLMAVLISQDSDFDPQERYTAGQCSYVTPTYCSGLRTFLGIAGLTRNIVKAGGNGRFGRRTFAWQGGGEITLAYLKRNVLGFSMDFAEDFTKSNWAFEFSWINKVRLSDSNSFSGSRDVQDFNLSISVDRPTFIRFLNSSRTFFMNLQMFLQYRDGYRKSMPSDGPFNFLFTFAVSTGYMQDRLLPTFAFVYDVNSQSGAAIPQVTYRVSSNFSIGFGVAFFWGAPSWNAMPLSNLLLGNRGGDRPYQNATYNGLGIIRERDEVFFRLRYTF